MHGNALPLYFLKAFFACKTRESSNPRLHCSAPVQTVDDHHHASSSSFGTTGHLMEFGSEPASARALQPPACPRQSLSRCISGYRIAAETKRCYTGEQSGHSSTFPFRYKVGYVCFKCGEQLGRVVALHNQPHAITQRMALIRRVPAILALLVAALLTFFHVVRFSSQPASLLGDRMQQGFPRWAQNRDGVFTMDTNPLDHSLWRQDTQAPFLPHLSIYTGRGVDRKSASLENVRLLLRVPKTFRARPWTGGYFVSDLEGPQMRFLYRTDNSILVVPPMSHAVGSISDEAATFLTGFLKRPSNAIMVLGSFQGVFFINENIALEDGSALSLKAVPAVGPFELQDNVVGTLWERAPMALPCPDEKGCVGVALDSLPQQAIVLYATLHSASVFAIPLGKAGIILYVGFDFDSSFSEVPPAWVRVLEVAKQYITQMSPSSPRIHSPGYTAYLQRKFANAERARSARVRYAKFLGQSKVNRKSPSEKPIRQSAKSHAAVHRTQPISKKQKANAIEKRIKREERHEARRELKKELQAAEAAKKASRERARRELKRAEKEAARQASIGKAKELAARKAAREQVKLQEKQRQIVADQAHRAARDKAKGPVVSEVTHVKKSLSASEKVTSVNTAVKESVNKKKKGAAGRASASSSSGSKRSKSSVAKAQVDAHVELDQIRAQFSQLHSQAYRSREVAASHFSHVQSSLDAGDRSSAASWVELFDTAVSNAHTASTAAVALSKKIVRHSISVVTKRRQAFLAARKARRIALHDLTKARALLSRGFYDRKMGYPVSHDFMPVLFSVLLVFTDSCFRTTFLGYVLSSTNSGHDFGSLRMPTPRQVSLNSNIHSMK
jgi:hypothetical protein